MSDQFYSSIGDLVVTARKLEKSEYFQGRIVTVGNYIISAGDMEYCISEELFAFLFQQKFKSLQEFIDAKSSDHQDVDKFES